LDSKKTIAQVLLPLPTDQTFDFLVPPELEKIIAVGKRVRIRFQESERWGIVADLAQESDPVSYTHLTLPTSDLV